MTKSRTELMVDRLREMQAASPEIEASAVVSVDGLIMASALPAEVEEDRVSAMSAAMLSLGERIASELPVNDAPEFAKSVPDIHLTEGLRSYQLDLDEYIDDPDRAFCAETVQWYLVGEDPNYVQISGENSTSTVLDLKIIDADFNGNHKLQLYLVDSQGAAAKHHLPAWWKAGRSRYLATFKPGYDPGAIDPGPLPAMILSQYVA